MEAPPSRATIRTVLRVVDVPVLSTSVLGLVFSTTVIDGGLHLIAVVSGLLLVASMATRRHSKA